MSDSCLDDRSEKYTGRMCAVFFLLFVTGFLCPSISRAGESIYVSISGHDFNDGKKETPLRTLEGARDAIRQLRRKTGLPDGGVTVLIEKGVYRRTQTFVLQKEDSGEPGKPIVYRSASGNVTDVSLNGGIVLGNWKSVIDKSVLKVMPELAREKVLVEDLVEAGISDVPDFNPYCNWTDDHRRQQINPNGLWLSFKGQAMRLASWPNQGWGDYIRNIPYIEGKMITFRGQPANTLGQFYVNQERAQKWAQEKELWCRGYFAVTYADDNQQVKSIDPKTGLIELFPPYHHYGYKKDNPNHDGARSTYTIANALSELDEPGEFRVDRENGKIYFWPPEEIRDGDAQVPLMSEPLIEVHKASYITFHGITIENARSAGIIIDKGSDVGIEKCILRNLGNIGVKITGGENHFIRGCDIHDLSAGGVSIVGGNRQTLTPCNHTVDNTHIYRIGLWERTYRPGIGVNGVGAKITHCLLNDLPHTAYLFRGNDHRFEYNEIHSVARQTTEVGAIYTGRDWASYGNEIHFNYIHDIYGPIASYGLGVHLDDAASGISIYGNIFSRMRNAIALYGGRSIKIKNNLFAGCTQCALILGYRYTPQHQLAEKLRRFPYKTKPWSTKYPELVNVLEETPEYPEHGVVTNNISLGGMFINWRQGDGGEINRLKKCFEISSNDWSAIKTLEVGRTNSLISFNLPEDSVQYSSFKKLPTGKIGLYKSALRATWPVVNQVSPKPDDWQKRDAESHPVVNAVFANGTIKIDGEISENEWHDDRFKETWGENPNDHFVVNKMGVGKTTPLSSTVRIRHDDSSLYVAVKSMIDPKKTFDTSAQWGRSDAVELAFGVNVKKTFCILILRGYPKGEFESSDEAGTPTDLVEKAAEGVVYRASVNGMESWSCEWKIPFDSLGIKPAQDMVIPFNVTVRQSGRKQWVMWCPTRTHSWRVDLAGQLMLVK